MEPTKKYKYKYIDTSTLKGLKQAERLQSYGWQPISITLMNIVTLRKEVRSK